MDPSLTVLLAEDDHDDAFLMQRALHSLGVTRPLHIVHDGVQAIEYLSGEGAFSDRVTYPPANYVILDLKMPRKDGFQVLEFLKEHPELMVIPTLILSSSTDVRDVKRSYCLGANGFLTKPHNFDELRAMLQTVVAYWGLCRLPNVDTAPPCEELKGHDPFSGTGWHR